MFFTMIPAFGIFVSLHQLLLRIEVMASCFNDISENIVYSMVKPVFYMAFYHCLAQVLQQRGHLMMLFVNYSDFGKILVRENGAVFRHRVLILFFKLQRRRH